MNGNLNGIGKIEENMMDDKELDWEMSELERFESEMRDELWEEMVGLVGEEMWENWYVESGVVECGGLKIKMEGDILGSWYIKEGVDKLLNRYGLVIKDKEFDDGMGFDEYEDGVIYMENGGMVDSIGDLVKRVCHEIGHWLVCSEEERKMKNYGLSDERLEVSDEVWKKEFVIEMEAKRMEWLVLEELAEIVCG